MAHAHCMLDTQGYKHTLRIRNIYCFSTAKVVARKGLNIACPVQGDQKVSVHLTITVQNARKITVFATVSITYHDDVVRIRDNRWR